MTNFLAVTNASASDAKTFQILFIVFAVIAAALTVFTILLFVSEKFRNIFFKPKNTETKKTDAKTPNADKRDKNKPSSNSVKQEKPKETEQTEKPNGAARGRAVYIDPVPTIPLSAPTSLGGNDVIHRARSAKLNMNMTLGVPQPVKTYSNSLDHIPTVVLTSNADKNTPGVKTTATAKKPVSHSPAQKAEVPVQTKPTATSAAKKATASTKPTQKTVFDLGAVKAAAKPRTKPTAVKNAEKTVVENQTAKRNASADRNGRK